MTPACGASCALLPRRRAPPPPPSPSPAASCSRHTRVQPPCSGRGRRAEGARRAHRRAAAASSGARGHSPRAPGVATRRCDEAIRRARRTPPRPIRIPAAAASSARGCCAARASAAPPCSPTSLCCSRNHCSGSPGEASAVASASAPFSRRRCARGRGRRRRSGGGCREVGGAVVRLVPQEQSRRSVRLRQSRRQVLDAAARDPAMLQAELGEAAVGRQHAAEERGAGIADRVRLQREQLELRVLAHRRRQVRHPLGADVVVAQREPSTPVRPSDTRLARARSRIRSSGITRSARCRRCSAIRSTSRSSRGVKRYESVRCWRSAPLPRALAASAGPRAT